MKKISKATVLVLSLIMIVGSTRVNSYAAETTNDILPKQILDIYFNPQSRLIASSSLAYLNITSSLKMELSLSLSLYRVFIINIAYLIDCLILIKWNTIIMTDYVSIVRNADIFTKSYKSNISESQKSAFLKYRHNIPTTFADF